MPPDLVVLLCDTARADAFEPWGAHHRTPVVQRLAHEGTLFESAASQAPWTAPSVASIFSGVLPSEHGITGACFRWIDRKPTSPAEAVKGYAGAWLPEELKERGYATWAASCNSWISEWGGFRRGFDALHDVRPWARRRSKADRLAYRARKGLGLMDRGGREVAERYSKRLAEVGAEPLFAFVDLMETHAPLNPPRPFYPFPTWRRPGTKRLAGGPDQGLSYNARVRTPDPGYVPTLRSLYYSCARYEDRLLGDFVRAIEAHGRPTVLVVVADHGENLGEHGLFNHNSSLHQTLLHVPLAVWGSGVDLAGGRVLEPVSLLRLGEWLRGLADGTDGDVGTMTGGEPVVSEYEGTLLHNGIPEEIRDRMAAEADPAVPRLIFHPGLAVRRGSLKYMAVGDGDRSVFDLSVDPGEEDDLAPRRPDLLAEFEPHRLAWETRRATGPTYETGEVAEGEIAEHLRVLGYIE